MTAGTEYALVFDTVTGGTVYGSSDTYPAGQAWILNSGSWGSITGLGSVPSDRPDWAFRTYVDTVGVDLEWDKTQIVGGQNTTLTLTATVTYTYGAVPTTYGAVPTSYTLFVGVIPTWFVPGSITCPASIPSGNCTLAALQGKGIIFSRSDGYETQTVTVTGTASSIPPKTESTRTGAPWAPTAPIPTRPWTWSPRGPHPRRHVPHRPPAPELKLLPMGRPERSCSCPWPCLPSSAARWPWSTGDARFSSLRLSGPSWVALQPKATGPAIDARPRRDSGRIERG